MTLLRGGTFRSGLKTIIRHPAKCQDSRRRQNINKAEENRGGIITLQAPGATELPVDRFRMETTQVIRDALFRFLWAWCTQAFPVLHATYFHFSPEPRHMLTWFNTKCEFSLPKSNLMKLLFQIVSALVLQVWMVRSGLCCHNSEMTACIVIAALLYTIYDRSAV